MNCPVCQSEIKDNASSCPFCGTRLFSSTPRIKSQTSHETSYPSSFPKKNYSIYIFVVSMILMILAVALWISGLSTTKSLADFIETNHLHMHSTDLALATRLLISLRIESLLTLAMAGGLLCLMVFSIKLKIISISIIDVSSVIKQANQQLGAAIFSLIASLAYIAFEYVSVKHFEEIILSLDISFDVEFIMIALAMAWIGLLISCVFIALDIIITIKKTYIAR